MRKENKEGREGRNKERWATVQKDLKKQVSHPWCELTKCFADVKIMMMMVTHDSSSYEA